VHEGLKHFLFTRPCQQHDTAGVGGMYSEELYGAVESLIHRLQLRWQTLAVVTWYAQKNILKSFIDKLELEMPVH
jgi:hypothetical protein